MSEAMSDALSNLRDHALSLPSAKDAKDAKDAVLSHVASLKAVDSSALRDKLPREAGTKRSVGAVLLGLVAIAGAAFVALRRTKANASAAAPSIYTPPLPRP